MLATAEAFDAYTRTNPPAGTGPELGGRGWRIGIADGDGDDLLGSVVSAALSADLGQLLEVVATEDQFDFFDADGTRHHFIKGGLAGPGWHSPPGVNLTLSDYLVGSERRYRATRPDGVTYEFRPTSGAYGLTSISDRKGNTLTFAYSSGRLSSITDTTGRTIAFAWSGDYLSSATFSGSGGTQTVTYTVDASSGRLTSVAAGGRTVSYTYRGSYDPLGEGLATATDGRGNSTTFTYNQSGMLTNLTDRANKNWPVVYNSTSCQPGSEEAVVATCVTDPEGGEWAYTSSAQGNLLQVRDPGDPEPNSREYAWESNRLVWESDEGSNTTEYAYNALGQVILKRESGGSDSTTSAFTYRDVSPGVADLVSARMGVGSGDERVWRFGLAGNGDVRSVTDPEGNVTTFSHYVRGLLKSVTDPRGFTTTYGNTAAADGGYHPSGQPPSVIDPSGHTMTFSYNFLGRPTAKVDRNGSTWSFAYDARGNLTSQGVPGGGTTSFAYDLNDNQTSATPPGGATTTNTYDARDLPTVTQATVGGVLRKSTYTYDDAGRLEETFEPRTYAGSPTVTQKVSYQHYPNSRVAAMTDEEGKRTEVTYTPEGRVQTVRRPPGTAGPQVTTYTYNRRGQVTSAFESGHSRPTTHRYSVHGERLSTTSPKGAFTSFDYDKLGRVIRITDPAGKHSERFYDPASNLMRVTQPVNNGGAITTSYAYTPRGEIASESDPSDGAHTISYEYDDEGRQRFRRDRYNGDVVRTLEQTYRADGAVTERIASATGRPTHRSTFTYDAAGHPTSANAFLDGAQVSGVSVSYNAAFEPTSVTESIYPPSGAAVTKIVSYAYQPDGLLASRTVDGQTTTFTHTKNGLEKTATPWGSQGSFTNTYLDNGALQKTTLPNGATAEHLYDPAERLTSRIVRTSDASVLSSWTAVAYDDDDHRTHETVAQAQPPDAAVPVKSGNASYAYDAAGRLTGAKHPFDPEAVSYTLDDAGNVISESGPGMKASYSYYMNRLGAKWFTAQETTESEGGPKITTDSWGLDTYAYDSLGDLSRVEAFMTAVVTTKAENTVVAIEVPFSNITTTTYDAASHTKRVSESDGSYVDYVYDAASRLVRRIEHPATGADVVRLFFHDGTSQQIALETDASGSVKARYLLDSAGRSLGQDAASQRSYLVSDPRGNVTQLLGHDQGVKGVFAYDPFGKDRALHTATAEGWDSRLRFQTAPRDPTTGAYALGPRMYDPSINRFAQADHYAGAAANMALATDPLTGNRYLYAGANPVGMVDDGHAPSSADWHPTSWELTNWYYRGWVSWSFNFRYSWNQYKQGFDEWYTADWRLRLDEVGVYIRINSTARGSCASCWDRFTRYVDKSLDQVVQRAVRHAERIVMGRFATFIKDVSWKWDVSWDEILDVLDKGVSCAVEGYYGARLYSPVGLYMTGGHPVGGLFGGIAGAVGGCAWGIWGDPGSSLFTPF